MVDMRLRLSNLPDRARNDFLDAGALLFGELEAEGFDDFFAGGPSPQRGSHGLEPSSTPAKRDPVSKPVSIEQLSQTEPNSDEKSAT